MKSVRCFSVIGLWVLAIISFSGVTYARSIFEIEVTSEGQSYTESFDNMWDFIHGLDTDEISGNLSRYNDRSAASASLDIRGLSAFANFNKNSPVLYFDIPSIKIHEVFRGSTRDESADLFQDWLKENGNNTISKLMRGFAAETPNDPIAGNPHSLMGIMVGNDFNRAFSSNTSEIELRSEKQSEDKPSEESKTSEAPKEIIYSNLIAIDPRVGSLRQGGVDNRQFTLPLAYTVRFNSDPRYQLKFSMPITWVEVDGANSYSAGLGVGFTIPVTDQWSLTPGVSYGAVGSVDLASLSQIASGALTSTYSIPIKKYTVKIGNMGGYYKTVPFPFTISGFDVSNFDPELSNTVFRNGVMFSVPTEQLIKNTELELFFTDTRYFGSTLYIDNYEEVGFSYGFKKTERKTVKEKIKNCLNDFRGGATYLFSGESHGYSFNLGYTF